MNVSISSLPIPDPIPGQPELTYNGAVPVRMSHAEYDHEGELLFFIIDGRIYNRNGYLLVRRTSSFTDYYGSYKENYINYAVCKVPGHCDKFYIFFDSNIITSSLIDDGEENELIEIEKKSDFGVVILDFSLESVFFPEDPDKKGRLVNLSNLPANYAMNIDASLVHGITGTSLDVHTQRVIAHSPAPSVDTQFTEQPILFSIIDQGPGQSKFLVTRRGADAHLWELTPNGIIWKSLDTPCLGSANNYYRLFETCSLFFQDGILNVMTGADDSFSGYWLIQNGQNAECFIGQQGIAFELSENKEYFYFVTSTGQLGYSPITGFESFNANTYFPWTYNTASYASGVRLARNFFQGEPSLFIFHSQGMDVIKGVNNPLTCTFHPNPFGLSALPIPISEFLASYLNDPTQPEFINYQQFALSPIYFQAPFQVYNYSSDIEQQQGECCIFNYEDEALGNVTVETSQTWTPEDNPYDEPMLLFIGNLVIPSGVSLTLNNMVLRFAENAGIIVEAGGRLIANHSTLTSYVCADLMWNGIDLLGTTNANNSIAQSLVLGGAQGICRLQNTTIENALSAVEVGTMPNSGGGILQARNSIFKNNRRDIRFAKFYFINGSGIAQNVSLIRNCQFLTTQLLNDPDIVPLAHIQLNQIHKLRIRECDFINSSPLSAYNWPQRRIGVNSFRASVEVRGTENMMNRFERLQAGIVSLGMYDPVAHLSCRYMTFEECNAGIINSFTNNIVVIQNVFNVPEIAGSQGARERGIQITGSTGYTIGDNLFRGVDDPMLEDDFPYGLGIWVAESGANPDHIENNDFQELYHGIYTEGINADIENKSSGVGLQFFCNDFSECIVDMYLHENSIIRVNQGGNQEGEEDAEYRNTDNRFSESIPNCGSRHDFLISENNPDVFFIDYFCANDQVTIPNCSPEEISVYLFTEDWSFESACPDDYVTTFEDGQLGTVFQNYPQRVTALRQRLEEQNEHYQIIVDDNKTQPTLQYINTLHSEESAFLRDLLLQRFPLSDEVLSAMLRRFNDLNPSHLAEVLIANSPLSRPLLQEVEDQQLLPPFLLYLVQSANGQNNIPNLRKKLELEMTTTSSLLERERNLLFKEIIASYSNNDSILVFSNFKVLDSLYGSNNEENNIVFRAGRFLFSDNL